MKATSFNVPETYQAVSRYIILVWFTPALGKLEVKEID